MGIVENQREEVVYLWRCEIWRFKWMGLDWINLRFLREYGRSRWTMADRPAEICQILPTRQTQSPISLRVAIQLISPQVSQFRFHSIAKPRFARTCAPANRKWNFHLDRGSSRDLHVHDHHRCGGRALNFPLPSVENSQRASNTVVVAAHAISSNFP